MFHLWQWNVVKCPVNAQNSYYFEIYWKKCSPSEWKFAIGDIVYDSFWYNFPSQMQKYFVLMIQRSHVGFNLSGYHFFSVSMATFLEVWSSSFSIQSKIILENSLFYFSWFAQRYLVKFYSGNYEMIIRFSFNSILHLSNSSQWSFFQFNKRTSSDSKILW